jgi:hypothetical protein
MAAISSVVDAALLRVFIIASILSVYADALTTRAIGKSSAFSKD